jgi:hypothetical protein
LQLLPVQAPPKPENLYPTDALAFKATSVLLLKVAVQTEGQFIPAALLMTVPLPETLTLNCAAIELSVAEGDLLS